MISVLIVEDEPLIAEAHRTYVTRLDGFSVAAVAHTARDAMRAAAEAVAAGSPVDLVLLDIGLPDASGIALASGLSGLRPAPDIIAITSERDLEMVRAAVAHGAVTYLLKPFTFAAFRDRLERYRRTRRVPASRKSRSRRRSGWPSEDHGAGPWCIFLRHLLTSSARTELFSAPGSASCGIIRACLPHKCEAAHSSQKICPYSIRRLG